MALKNDINDAKAKAKTAQAPKDQAAQSNGPRVNPEIDAKLNAFIAANPKLADWYRAQDKELLVRKLMLARMNKEAATNKVEDKVRQWVNERPELKAQLESRLKNVPAERQGAAFVAMAKREMQNQALRSIAPRQSV